MRDTFLVTGGIDWINNFDKIRIFGCSKSLAKFSFLQTKIFASDFRTAKNEFHDIFFTS